MFEDCGWEHAASQGFLHIFRAPAGSNAPEFYSAPAQQAETLKKVRRNLWISWVLTLFALALAVWIIPFAGKPWGKVFGEQFKRFVQVPTLYATEGTWLLWAIYELAWGTWKINHTYHRLKKGVPLDHAPQGHRIPHKLLHPGLLCLSALCLLLTVGQFISTRSEDLPAQPDGPYIMLSDIGWDGQRTDFMGRSSSVTHTASPLTEYWETVEYICTPDESTIWMRQHIYRLRFPGMADTLAQALMEAPILAHGSEAFSSVDAEGFDTVWAAGQELVAVKGDMVAYMMTLGQNDDRIDYSSICAALYATWES